MSRIESKLGGQTALNQEPALDMAEKFDEGRWGKTVLQAAHCFDQATFKELT